MMRYRRGGGSEAESELLARPLRPLPRGGHRRAAVPAVAAPLPRRRRRARFRLRRPLRRRPPHCQRGGPLRHHGRPGYVSRRLFVSPHLNYAPLSKAKLSHSMLICPAQASCSYMLLMLGGSHKLRAFSSIFVSLPGTGAGRERQKSAYLDCHMAVSALSSPASSSQVRCRHGRGPSIRTRHIGRLAGRRPQTLPGRRTARLSWRAGRAEAGKCSMGQNHTWLFTGLKQ